MNTAYLLLLKQQQPKKSIFIDFFAKNPGKCGYFGNFREGSLVREKQASGSVPNGVTTRK